MWDLFIRHWSIYTEEEGDLIASTQNQIHVDTLQKKYLVFRNNGIGPALVLVGGSFHYIFDTYIHASQSEKRIKTDKSLYK